jgi:steroid delta-isomerase-like uncharacterized protein
MTRDDVVAVLERRVDVVVRRDWNAFSQLYADKARMESPLGGSVQGPEAITKATEAFFVAFPDAVIVTEPPIVDGNRAMMLAEYTGTHHGGMMGLPPSGRPFRIQVAQIFVVEDHRIVDDRRIYDFTGMLVQIGVLKAKPA